MSLHWHIIITRSPKFILGCTQCCASVGLDMCITTCICHCGIIQSICTVLKILLPWPPHAKSWLIGKDSDAGRDWGQEEKGTTEDEMAGWHHRLDECESGWTPGVGDGRGGLACCDSWGRKESDTTERLNWTELKNSLCSSCSLFPSLSQPLASPYLFYSLSFIFSRIIQ